MAAGPVEKLCQVCASAHAPFGFHGRFFCPEHRAQGEVLIASTQDGQGMPIHQPPPGAPKQGRLI